MALPTLSLVLLLINIFYKVRIQGRFSHEMGFAELFFLTNQAPGPVGVSAVPLD